ncbi:MAG: hypothetical protein FWB72_01835 [Firmicutes bacterium]|nr:hypothetical protein [Bacillota bacterium]
MSSKSKLVLPPVGEEMSREEATNIDGGNSARNRANNWATFGAVIGVIGGIAGVATMGNAARVANNVPLTGMQQAGQGMATMAQPLSGVAGLFAGMAGQEADEYERNADRARNSALGGDSMVASRSGFGGGHSTGGMGGYG